MKVERSCRFPAGAKRSGGQAGFRMKGKVFALICVFAPLHAIIYRRLNLQLRTTHVLSASTIYSFLSVTAGFTLDALATMYAMVVAAITTTASMLMMKYAGAISIL